MKRFRETRLGRFVSSQEATTHPDTTVGETISDTGKELAALRWRVEALQVVVGQAAGDLRNMVMHDSITADRVAAVADRLENAP